MQISELNIPGKKRASAAGPAGHGKTSGRGTKGGKARSGFKHKHAFEGGQMPLQRRIPKRGFRPLDKTQYQLVNVQTLERFDEGQTVDAPALKAGGLIKSLKRPVKILGTGTLSKKLTVQADRSANPPGRRSSRRVDRPSRRTPRRPDARENPCFPVISARQRKVDAP